MDAQGIPEEAVQVQERQFTEEEMREFRERAKTVGTVVITATCVASRGGVALFGILKGEPMLATGVNAGLQSADGI